MTYQRVGDGVILRVEDDMTIPPDYGNADYREYLAWVEEGNIAPPVPVPLRTAPDYVAMWDELIASTLYQKVLVQSFASLPVASAKVDFLAAFTDAKLGRPNIAAMQAAINIILSFLVLEPEDYGELAAMMQRNNLDDLFTIPEVPQ